MTTTGPTMTNTHRRRGDRGLAEEPLSLLELAVPPVVFAVGIPIKRENQTSWRGGESPAGAGQGKTGTGAGLTSGW